MGAIQPAHTRCSHLDTPPSPGHVRAATIHIPRTCPSTLLRAHTNSNSAQCPKGTAMKYPDPSQPSSNPWSPAHTCPICCCAPGPPKDPPPPRACVCTHCSPSHRQRHTHLSVHAAACPDHCHLCPCAVADPALLTIKHPAASHLQAAAAAAVIAESVTYLAIFPVLRRPATAAAAVEPAATLSNCPVT